MRKESRCQSVLLEMRRTESTVPCGTYLNVEQGALHAQGDSITRVESVLAYGVHERQSKPCERRRLRLDDEVRESL